MFDHFLRLCMKGLILISSSHLNCLPAIAFVETLIQKCIIKEWYNNLNY